MDSLLFFMNVLYNEIQQIKKEIVIYNFGGVNMDKKKMMNWIIAITVAVVYLVISIAFNAWAYSWLIWVAYAIYRFIVKQKDK